MYKTPQHATTSIQTNESYIGETIEQKIRRIVNNNEPITDGAPLTYTERREGVKPEYNIRTDRWEVALDAMTLVSKTQRAKREPASDLGAEARGKTETKNHGETEPTRTTE